MATPRNIFIILVVVVVTAGVSFWVGAVIGYNTGQRTAQFRLRAKIVTNVQKCWALPRFDALACRFKAVIGPDGLNMPAPRQLKPQSRKFELPKIKP